MKRMFRLVLSCCLGLLLPAIIFPWLVQALVPAKKSVPSGSFKPAPDSSGEVGHLTPPSAVKTTPKIE